MTVRAQLEEVMRVAAVEVFRPAGQGDGDGLDLADADAAPGFQPLVGPPGDADRPAQRDDLARDRLLERPAGAFRLGLLAERLVPLPTGFRAPRRAARARARARSERGELLRADLDAPGFDVDAHQGSTK